MVAAAAAVAGSKPFQGVEAGRQDNENNKAAGMAWRILGIEREAEHPLKRRKTVAD